MISASYPIGRAFTSIAVCLLLLVAPPFARAQTAGGGQVVGFEDASGKTLFLHDFKGRPVVINLWASWCAPCVKEMPSLAKMQQDYASKGLVVLALSEDETIGEATAFYKKNNITALTPYLDKGHGVYAALNPKGLPTTILVTKEGKMIQRVEGPVDWQTLQVKAILAEIVGK